ncbi:SIS domain-containing protein [Paracoccaceae bacterium]|nr:SIS domain-containing protein [Paracoccaceae bacterium]
MASHIKSFFNLVGNVATSIDEKTVECMVKKLIEVRNRGGRLFLLGVGGSSANCSHACNDFRKLCNIETYAPTDNISELTARINDDGWDSTFAGWLKVSKLGKNDAILVLSVGGGDVKRGVSVNLVRAIDFAKLNKATVLGIVGRDGGYTKEKGDVVVVVPDLARNLVTPISESFQAVIWHCIVSHPDLQVMPTKW